MSSHKGFNKRYEAALKLSWSFYEEKLDVEMSVKKSLWREFKCRRVSCVTFAHPDLWNRARRPQSDLQNCCEVCTSAYIIDERFITCTPWPMKSREASAKWPPELLWGMHTAHIIDERFITCKRTFEDASRERGGVFLPLTVSCRPADRHFVYWFPFKIINK